MFSLCFPCVPLIFSVCAPYGFRIFLLCSPYVTRTLSLCLPYVFLVLPLFPPYLFLMFPYVSLMFPYVPDDHVKDLEESPVFVLHLDRNVAGLLVFVPGLDQNVEKHKTRDRTIPYSPPGNSGQDPKIH